MSDLRTVKQARAAADAATAGLQAAIREAVANGERAALVAEAAGLSRQRVYQLVGPVDWRVKAEKRLAELDARYEKLVDVMAEVERPPDSYVKLETAKRNGRRGKDARAGRPQRSTVLQETRAFAESKLLRTLADNPQDPRVVALVAEIDEAEGLRQALQAANDRALGIAD